MGENIALSLTEQPVEDIRLGRVEPRPEFDPTIRNYEDVVTWLAEVVPGALRNSVEYSYINGDLYSEDGSCVRELFKKGLDESLLLPKNLAFEYRRRRKEYDEYCEMNAMLYDNSINSILVVSDFPPEIMMAQQDIGGYNVKRRQTMLRFITKSRSGGLRVTTQTLDGSDRQALEEIYETCGYVAQPGELLGQRMKFLLTEDQQEIFLNHARDTYDLSLAKRLGGSWFAGIKGQDRRNTYEFVKQQDDLLSHYFAKATQFSGGASEYNLAAAIKQRFNDKERGKTVYNSFGSSIVSIAQISSELQSAGVLALAAGEKFSGCGATVGGDNSLDNQADLFNLGYGNKSVEDKYGPLQFKCPNGHNNARPYNQLIEKCKTCGTSVSCK